MTTEEAIERFENVKANALVQKASGVSEYWQNEIDGTIEALDMAIEALQFVEHFDLLKEFQSLQEVVRCKDCKWAEKAILDEYCVECTMYHTSCMKHGYCNHGERREE